MQKQAFAWVMVLGAAVVLQGCKETESQAEVAQPEAAMTAEVAVAEAAPASSAEGDSTQPAVSAVVVTVNGEKLDRAAMERQMQQVLGSPQFAALPPEQAAMIKQQVEGQIVSQFIDQTLLRAAADAADVTVTDEEVDGYIEELRAYFADGESLEARMELQGISMEDLRRDIVADMKIRGLLDQMTESVAAAEETAVQAYYDENRAQFSVPESVSARHILIQVEEDADEETRAAARTKLEGIREQLRAGEMTFEAAAAEHSSCPSSQRGGDLGQFSRGQMVPPFEDAAFTQPIGEVGDVVETSFGYHLIQVEERQEASAQAFEDVKDDIAEQLVMGEKQQMVQDYIGRLREEADIQYGD